MTTTDVRSSLVRALTGSATEPTITVERRYRTDREDLWTALTDPQRLAR